MLLLRREMDFVRDATPSASSRRAVGGEEFTPAEQRPRETMRRSTWNRVSAEGAFGASSEATPTAFLSVPFWLAPFGSRCGSLPSVRRGAAVGRCRALVAEERGESSVALPSLGGDRVRPAALPRR